MTAAIGDHKRFAGCCRADSLSSVVPGLAVKEGQRRQLVNTPIHSVLLDLVASFLAKPAYRNSLPVMALDTHDVTLVRVVLIASSCTRHIAILVCDLEPEIGCLAP